jgi:hypothetical protein
MNGPGEVEAGFGATTDKDNGIGDPRAANVVTVEFSIEDARGGAEPADAMIFAES